MSRRFSGATLIELLAALAVGAVVVLAAAQLYATATRMATTAETAGRLADKTQLLHRLLREEIAPAGDAPCGAQTPVYGPHEAEPARVIGSLLEPRGLLMAGETLSIAWRRPDPAAAAAHYQRRDRSQEETEDDETIALRLSESVEVAFREPPKRILAGDCRRLFELEVLSASAEWLLVAAPAVPQALPEHGAVWVPWWGGVDRTGDAGGARPQDGLQEVRQLRFSGEGGADGVPTLNYAASRRGVPQPVVRGVATPELGFAECPGVSDPQRRGQHPRRFRSASAVTDWDAVCAVRFAAEVRAGGEHDPEGGSTRPVTVTIPIRGRMP
ncbi:MAG: prepilin-type N-terminal cleavage/methylation domain-containing protein [Halorhodospira sp.]